MAGWLKLLARMVADRKPRSYSYDEAATVLGRLGFTLATPTDGSHRKWRRVIEDASTASGRRTVIVGLIVPPRGNLPPEYVKALVEALTSNDLLPPGVSTP